MEQEILKTGDYLTDGERLVQVLHVIGGVVTVEEGDIDASMIGTVTTADIAAGAWRLLDVVEEDTATDEWLHENFPPFDFASAREIRLRMCGCSRCSAQLRLIQQSVDDGA